MRTRERPASFGWRDGASGTGFKKLNEGDQVKYDVIQGPKGPQAENVARIS